jgi:hypothetical protein
MGEEHDGRKHHSKRHDVNADADPRQPVAEADDQSEDDLPLPQAVVDEAERLTRRAREAVDDNEAAAYREDRDTLVAEYDYQTRIREDENDVLVLYPDEWMDDGTVQLDEIEDVERGIERQLEGAGDDDWTAVEAHNRALADDVAGTYGEIHGANAHALADFMSNHYAKHIEDATGDELTEFLDDYFPRNAWPSDDQREVVDDSIEYVFECADSVAPTWQ